MIKPFFKNIYLPIILLTLTACGGSGGTVVSAKTAQGSPPATTDESVPTAPEETVPSAPEETVPSAPGDTGPSTPEGSVPSTPEEPTPTVPSQEAALATGKTHFDSSCSTCHGSSGDNSSRPINVDNCRVADCRSIDSLASYIDENMPFGSSQACTLGGVDSCAFTTATYIFNNFSTEISNESFGPTEPEEPQEPSEPAVQNVPSPLARLTNDEYINSVRTLLSLASESPHINAAKNSLTSESVIHALTNDATTQFLTQLTVSGFSTMAIAASNDFLQDVSSKDELAELLDCTTLTENIDTSAPTRACVEEFSKNLIAKAYRRSVNDDDATSISTLYDSIISFNETQDNELFDITAHRNTIQAILQYIMLSPEFLLITENGKPDNSNATTKELAGSEIATRLSLFVAGALPDDALLADANAGLLENPEVRLQHAERLMSSQIGVTQFTTLVRGWLGIDNSVSDPDDLQALNAFISDWFVNEYPFSDLYQGPVTVAHVSGIETTEPMGILGLRAFVASHTSAPTPSFITRGVFVVESLLCEALPEDLPDAALDTGALTPLQVFEEHTKQPCASCHQIFDNYGAAFQKFNAETSLFDPSFQDFGTSFDLFSIGDINTSVSGLGDLGFSMASSQRASSCMTELWYRHSTRRGVDTQGRDDLELQSILNAWAESGDKSMKALLRAIVASDNFIILHL